MIDLQTLKPVIPTRCDELGWVTSRVDQVKNFLGCGFSNVRVWGTPKTVEKLKLLWDKRDKNEIDEWLGCEVDFTPLVGIIYDAVPGKEHGWFDDNTVEFEVITDSNDFIQFYGLVYDSFKPYEQVEMRWVLQMVDGFEGEAAESVANKLLK